MTHVDLNCDMGESFGAYRIGADEEVLPYVTSANIACGFHGGDPRVMRETIARAAALGVAVGAHPGFHDLDGFGRRNIDVTAQEAYDLVVYQVGALLGFAVAAGVPMRHVKAHGALYNMAAKDAALAGAIARAVADFDRTLVLFGLSGSALIRAGRDVGLKVANEVFADRTYQSDGSLTPRSRPGSMIEDVKDSLAQVEGMLTRGRVRALDGSEVSIEADTICVHGDQAGAAEFARELRVLLRTLGIEVASVSKQ